ncbi:hypothetical protein L6Q96_00680 [Candidatus Binatia bacterium]|nr:hypothetical protein [Candidatus Binatia bacterium]
MTRGLNHIRWQLSLAATIGSIVALAAMPVAAQRGSGGSLPLPQPPQRQSADGIRIEVIPSTRTPYAGEVIEVEVLITADRSRGGQVVGSPQWREAEGDTTATTAWSAPERTTVNGNPAIRSRSRAAATAAGVGFLPEIAQEVRVRGEGNRIGDAFKDRFFSGGFADDIFTEFFAAATTRTVTATSAPVALEVRPLPQPAPPGFSGAVGHFTLDSQLTPGTVKAGEPVTWSLTLRGTGNWPTGIDLPGRTTPAGTRTLKPKTRTEFAESERFTGSVTEELVLIPAEAGELQLDPVRFVYFDPDQGEYVTIQAAVPAIGVQPGPVPAQAQSVAAPAAAPAAPPAVAEAAVTRLPRGPIEGSAGAIAPFTTSVLLTALAVPFLLLAAFTLRLGALRARESDPLRSRRLAALRLASVVAAVRRAQTPKDREQALLDWQRTTVCALGLPTQAPTSTAWRALCLPLSASAGHEWTELWTHSERAIHAPDGTLPPEWCDRALRAARYTGLPRFNVLRSFVPRHLFATAAPAVVVAVLACSGPAAAGPLGDYQSGNFTAARDAWQQRVAAEPTDWIARYNLGLAEAQLGNSGHALAETTAAFLLHPRDDAARWNLGTFIDRTPAADSRLVSLVRGTGPARLATLLAPAGWQVTLALGAGLLMSASALALYRRHRGKPLRPARAAATLLPGIISLAAAATALHTYGPLSAPNAAMVAAETSLRSVPTAVAQVEKPIAAGGIVNIDRRFLDWVQVTRAGGEVGWLRSTDVVPLYATRPSPGSEPQTAASDQTTVAPG